MIRVSSDIISEILLHARRELPDEACGYLAGSDGIINKSYPLTNIDHSPEHFSFDPSEQFAAVRKARNENLLILASYHSHPRTPARPSDEDIRLAFDPNILYFIISFQEVEPDIQAFRIKNGKAERIQISLI